MPPTKTSTAKTTLTTETPVRALVRAFGLLERVMQPHFTRLGVTGAQWGVLRQLQQAEEAGTPGLRLSDLSERLLIRPPSVTSVVDRLERAQLVTRENCAQDSRARIVSLTSRGRQLFAQLHRIHTQQIQRILDGLEKKDQLELHHLLERLGNHLQQLLEQGVTFPDSPTDREEAR